MSEDSRLRIHAQLTPQSAAPVPEKKPLRWRSIPHPEGRRARRQKEKLTFSDRLLRNSAIACALLLAILALGNLQQPWAVQSSEAVRRALTMHIDLDESIGRLSFVQELMPESALVFLNLSGKTELERPVSGSVTHSFSEMQPWLMFACAEGEAVRAVESGVVTAVSQQNDGLYGILIDHGEGLESVCACLSTATVAPGESVERGQTIATAAQKMYFELRQSDSPIDPTEKLGL